MAHSARLSLFGFAMGVGLSLGLGLLLLGLLATYCDIGKAMVESLGSVYLGYSVGLTGSFIGGLWGFGDGFIGGFLIALFYNIFRIGR